MNVIGFICTIIVAAVFCYILYANIRRWLGVEDETTVIECTKEDVEILNKIKQLKHKDRHVEMLNKILLNEASEGAE